MTNFLNHLLNTGTPELGVEGIVLRLLCAMLVGLVIGTEREYSHRPAGMRTHILVALGACTVMITGELIFLQYHPLGATPDPSRLSAQVITGVGFLGAGTILREGATVKGLTTAASLWSVACLGIAAGAGYYAVALAGMVFIIITLSVFEVLQHKLVGSGTGLEQYIVETENVGAGLKAISTHSQSCRASVRDMLSEPLGSGRFRITFRAEIYGIRSKKRRLKFQKKLISDPAFLSTRFDLPEESPTAP